MFFHLFRSLRDLTVAIPAERRAPGASAAASSAAFSAFRAAALRALEGLAEAAQAAWEWRDSQSWELIDYDGYNMIYVYTHYYPLLTQHFQTNPDDICFITHRIHGAAIYGNIYHQYTPFMFVYMAYMDPSWVRG